MFCLGWRQALLELRVFPCQHRKTADAQLFKIRPSWRQEGHVPLEINGRVGGEWVVKWGELWRKFYAAIKVMLSLSMAVTQPSHSTPLSRIFLKKLQLFFQLTSLLDCWWQSTNTPTTRTRPTSSKGVHMSTRNHYFRFVFIYRTVYLSFDCFI